jgi:tRNA pseudouridine38-40 synthase
VTRVAWVDEGDGVLRFEIDGSAFCHQMVRSIVGLLVGVGIGKRRADEVPAVLAARDRAASEQPAPPQGLTLWQVDYDPVDDQLGGDVGAGGSGPIN